MDVLIDLFKDYFYIIGVVGYFIFKMFVNKEETKPNAMPTFGGENTQSYDEHEEELPRQQSAPKATNLAEQTRFDSQYTNTTTEFDSVKLEAARRRLYESQQLRSNQAKGNTVKQKTSTTVKPAVLEADDIRKAVIWSEILGQPRAKRPYRSTYRR